MPYSSPRHRVPRPPASPQTRVCLEKRKDVCYNWAIMARGDLTDAQWARLAPLLPPQRSGKRGRPYRDHREVLNGILWIQRTGAPWRDLPERYPSFGTCHDRLTRWERSGLWDRLLRALLAEADAQEELDWMVTVIDSSVVRAHQHAAGARRKPAAPAGPAVRPGRGKGGNHRQAPSRRSRPAARRQKRSAAAGAA